MKSTFLLPLFAVLYGSSWAAEPALTLKDNDTWVMAGDSITAQRLHSNYIEAFYRTRYPQWHLHFRNSGISGNRTDNLLARFNYDVAAWKPTIVSVELGMNDVGVPDPNSKDAPAGYVAGMKKLAEGIRALQAKPLFISSSPVNDGSFMDAWTSVRCRSIHTFTEALKDLGEKEKVPVIDQYHALIGVWGANKTLEDAGALAAQVRHLTPENNVPELSTLQAFAKSWEGKPPGIPLGGDPVHTGPIGQYTMAATILLGLDAEREVSSATLKSDGTVVSSKFCKITDVTAADGKLSFTRLDERSPWPLLPEGATAVKLMPEISDLSRYMLTISGLPAGPYRVSMNGKQVAAPSSEELAKGWNMSAVTEGPLVDRAIKIMALINQLQAPLNNAWREASKENNPEKLAAAQKALDDCETLLQAACQPTPIHFTVEPLLSANNSPSKQPTSTKD